MKVQNEHGTIVDFDAAVSLMDDTLRETVATQGCKDEQQFFNVYSFFHRFVFEEEFEPNKKNPCW